jgi:hypothetical protein
MEDAATDYLPLAQQPCLMLLSNSVIFKQAIGRYTFFFLLLLFFLPSVQYDMYI